MILGLIKEGKQPSDNRVALSPQQCKWVKEKMNIQILVQSSATRCFSDEEYFQHGIAVVDNMNDCDVLLGIKEVPTDMLIPNKQYLFFSHTKKKQPYNKKLLQTILAKQITLIDYECLEHADGQRLIGFGFFAGVVGAHNGIWAYGKRTGLFSLPRVYHCKDYRALIRYYFGLKLPNIKIVLTGSGRVAQGVIDVMNMMGIIEVEPEEYLSRNFEYPVYVQLKGGDLYAHKHLDTYKREHFHENPTEYKSLFPKYISCTDILMNGVFWDKDVPRLFEITDVDSQFNITTIADITDDEHGSVPINLGDQSIENPVYGINKTTLTKTAPFLKYSIDLIAVGNLPNELSRDASAFFGEQLIKYVLGNLTANDNDIIERATMTKDGKLTDRYQYLEDWVNEA